MKMERGPKTEEGDGKEEKMGIQVSGDLSFTILSRDATRTDFKPLRNKIKNFGSEDYAQIVVIRAA